MMNDIFDFLFPIFKIALCVLGCSALFSIIVACFIYIDSSNLEVIRYCPNCGIDLIQHR